MDLSGKRRNNAMNLEGQGPVFQKNSIDHINFNPVLEFNGSDQGLNFGDDEIFDPPVQDGMYWFMVIKPDVTSIGKLFPLVFDYGNYKSEGIGIGYGSNWISNYLPNTNGNLEFAKSNTGSDDVVLVRYELIFDDEFNIKLNSYETPFNSWKINIEEISSVNIAHQAAHSPWSGPFSIGRQSMSNKSELNEGRFFDGKICEIIGFSSLLTDSQIVQIESYLNIKYSVQRNVYSTLLNGKYIDSEGHILWDPMTDFNFNNHIVGIGCDSSLNFIQESSHSRGGNYELQISNEDSNRFDITSAHIQYVMSGSNGESANDFENPPSGSDERFIQRIKKSWKIVNSGFYGVFDLIFTSNAVLPEGQSWYLLVSDNDQFVNPQIYKNEVYRNGDSLVISEISSNQIPDGSTKFLAVAYGKTIIDTTPIEDPNNLSNFLWLRADIGVTTDLAPSSDGQNITSWIDQSGYRKKDAEYSRIIGPMYRNNEDYFVNYHPVLEFNGVSHSLNFGDDFLFIDSAFKEVNFFTVVKPDEASPVKTGQNIFDFGQTVPSGYGLKYGNTKASIYTGTDYGGLHISADHTFGTQPVVLHFRIRLGDKQELFINGANNPFIESNIQVSELTKRTISANEVSIEMEGPFTIGSQSKLFWIDNNGKRYFDGRMLEIIGYKSTMSNDEVDQIESYLSVKYGICRIHDEGQANGNYVLSNGDIVWNAMDAPLYQHDIIGIGRDDSVGLNQKQSQSIDNKMRIYFGTELFKSNNESSHVFGDDFKSLLIGHTNDALLSEGSEEFPPNHEIFSRVEREWKVVNHKFYSSFSIDIELPTDSLNPHHLRLIVDSDDNLADGEVVKCDVAVNENTVTLRGLDMTIFPVNATRYFTLASINEITPLPVTLLSFDANLEKDVIVLEWITESEINNDRFEVHKSTDGRTWNRIDQVSGSGNSRIKQYYQSWDYDLVEGTSYYKLIQVDFDGKTEEFGPVSVNFDGMQKKIKIFPNPFSTEFTIDLGSDYTNDVSVRLFDVAGRLYYSNTFIPQFGVIKVVPENLKVGVYLIDIQAQGLNHSAKLLYQPSYSSVSPLKINEIEQAIIRTEKSTNAEIIFVATNFNEMKVVDPQWSSHLFYQFGMYKTQHRNALMVLWDEKSGSMSFEGDERLINSPVKNELQEIMNSYKIDSEKNQYDNFTFNGLFEEIGKVLGSHYKSTERNKNEIPNYVVSQ